MGEWSQKTIFDLYRLRARIGWQGLKAHEFLDDGPYLITGTNFHDGKISWDDCYHISESRYNQDTGIQIHENDLLITKDGTIGKTAVAINCPPKAALNSGVFVLHQLNRELDSKYLYYVLNSHVFELFIRNILTGSTIKHLNQEHFYKFSFTYPKQKAEQAKIVQILATVDEVISKTKSIIEKYKAVKEGLMQNLLANGIDENGVMRSQKTHKYKDSPLGKIPVEWDAVPILRLGTVSGGSTPKTNEASNWGETHVWITPNDLSNISGKYIFSSERKITDKGLNQATRQLLPPNSFIISCRAPVGYCAVVKVPFSHNQGCKSIVPNELIISEYLYYSLVGKKASLERVSYGTTFLELPKKELESFLIAVPQEIKEQEAIISRLNSIDSKIEIELRNLSKYQAIKNGLMQDLLTHKVPVDPLVERSVENE